MSKSATPQAVTAVLKDALDRCERVLGHLPHAEVDLRDGLCWLRWAADLAGTVMSGDGAAPQSPLLTEAAKLADEMMVPLQKLNPGLSSWSRAMDPAYALSMQSTRKGAQAGKPFDPLALRNQFDAMCDKFFGMFPAPSRGEGEGPLPQEAPAAPEQIQGGQRPPTSARNHDTETRGPPVGDFLIESSGTDRRGPARGFRRQERPEDGTSDSGSDYSRARRRRGRGRTRYGHQEDDEAFFDQRFGAAQDALQRLRLGDQFRYPSDRAFKKHFPYCDFQKAMKTGGLPKFDGTVRGYAGFRNNFYNMVFVQREHYLSKLLALEDMVPEKVKQSLFHGLQNTLQDFGHRLTEAGGGIRGFGASGAISG